MSVQNPPGVRSDENAVTSGTNSPDIYHYKSQDAEEWGVYTPPQEEQNNQYQQYPIVVEPHIFPPALQRPEPRK